MTKRHNQVTCYGEKGKGDANDIWRVEVVTGAGTDGQINTVTTKFRLVHHLTNCALLSHNKQLPKWGFDQMEVSNPESVMSPLCIATSIQIHHIHSIKHILTWLSPNGKVTCTPNKRDKNTIWNVEDNWFSGLPSESFERYRPGFLQMFLESHAVMVQVTVPSSLSLHSLRLIPAHDFLERPPPISENH